MLRKQKVYILPHAGADQGNGDITPGFDKPIEALASVYPITDSQEAKFYGLEPNESYRLIFPWNTNIHKGDGVWIDEAGEGKPPFEVVACPSWMLTIQAVVKKVTGWRK